MVKVVDVVSQHSEKISGWNQVMQVPVDESDAVQNYYTVDLVMPTHRRRK